MCYGKIPANNSIGDQKRNILKENAPHVGAFFLGMAFDSKAVFVPMTTSHLS